MESRRTFLKIVGATSLVSLISPLSQRCDACFIEREIWRTGTLPEGTYVLRRAAVIQSRFRNVRITRCEFIIKNDKAFLNFMNHNYMLHLEYCHFYAREA